MEFNANLLNGVAPPRYVCQGKVDISDKYPDFELGYNQYHKYVYWSCCGVVRVSYLGHVHYHVLNYYLSRGGADMPHTLAYINKYVRPASVLTDYHISVWETLTNSGSP